MKKKGKGSYISYDDIFKVNCPFKKSLVKNECHEKSEFKNHHIKRFYTKHMEANTLYTTLITGASDNKTYKDIINKKINLMNMDIKIIFKFYESLHILCNIYNEDKEKNINCTKLSKDAEEFVKKYKEFNKYPNIKSGHSSIQDNAELSAQGSEATSSSSSITSRLIPVLSAFIAIPIFLGIAYKYSLFGIDKLFQRQYLRETPKKN
ncbi:hypothetical protein YYG_03257 [Plasmodium vinckei petteri]|uniref:PIR protein CIR protein n=1 Tax=Plasmodium vinckei petteri TaxID=138298 RepID=W7AJ99_PLAVN|nr:hypothetical protein YYG_03257 [Plasmodium vinckei petteri]